MAVRGAPETTDPGLQNDYDVLDGQISGPGGLATERRDILAKVAAGQPVKSATARRRDAVDSNGFPQLPLHQAAQ
ncbi:MAG TPA: hypothetical protein VGG72_03725 [Bryobacteraceae bacterium]|jgi:hypothetical protein